MDPGTHTAYVANQADRTVSVIDTRKCNIAGGDCATSWPTVSVGEFPQAFAIDLATDTVYVANYIDNGTVSVFDGATCDATNHIGVRTTGAEGFRGEPAGRDRGRRGV